MNTAIIGGQYGDEAKARCAHYFAKDHPFVVRWSGGANCGHTIYHQNKKIVRHLIPSADFSTNHNKAFLASGMVINLEELLQEVQETEAMFPGAAKRIIVDPDAFVVFDKHIQEDKDKNKYIGSTNKGITPAYKDKIGRTGTKIRSLINDKADIIEQLLKLGVQFKYVLELKEIMERSKLLFEGSQSIQLDLNFGDYPFVTSGNCGLGGIYDAGFAFAPPKHIYGIVKCYLTKSGGGIGQFPTELPEEEAKLLRERGNEIGATTGRPRRIGAMDLPALKYSIIKGGINRLILTKLDILNGQNKIKVCYDYGKSIFSGNDFQNAIPHYVELPGWQDARDFKQIKPFIKHIEDYVNVPVEYVSVGVNDEDMIKLSNIEDNSSTATERFTDPFENVSESDVIAPLQLSDLLTQQDTPINPVTEVDKSFKAAGFPSLTEVIGDIIKNRLIKKNSN